MASQNIQEQQYYQEGRAIQLIRCIPPTDEERKNPRFVPQLEIDREAKQIIAERFETPISVIVYVGNMGVGKSKLATMTITALEKEQHHQTARMFRSGAGANGVTQGVWMWSEPLQHPKQETNESGSILILDCEGMGDLDENTGANLYLFCMLISTAFVVILRPSRVDRYQCNRLYQALYRFERMRAQYVLPNLWLLPLDLPEFVYSDPKTSEDVPISEEQWINNIFTVDEENNRLSNDENQALKNRYKYIIDILPKIRAANIHHLPPSLHSNSRKLDTYSLLRSKESDLYATSITIAIKKFLANGGKRLLGSIAQNMFVRPSEFAELMDDLIQVINRDPVPNPDELINQYLTNRFTAELEKEYVTRFEHDLMNYVTKQCEKLSELQKPPSDEQIATIIGEMAHQRDQNHEKQGCIQLIRCIPPTDEERKNPQYVPQLEINQQAQQIISDRFEAPISIIVYAGNMGVGKSKLATVTVAALEKEPHGTDLLWFRSGAGTNGVTQGVWMWCEPLRHPDQDEQTKGSILVLDCEGMDNLDENTAANLYFFCMIISTAFVVVLRPARIDRFQCDRLYIALRRFEFMKSFHVLPNVWLLPLDLPKFLHIDPDTGDDIEISKEEWLHKIFSVNDERNNLSSAHNQRLKEQYEYITPLGHWTTTQVID
ncbi:unnamed protein product [Rotaria sordida]|uniref:Guanylate-binding protein N-terminal domain-containing protein n=1 Tax=Rotaria sordida TaxID=392033 RepID=A0A815H8J3_9BILA|nr:unnamed protein product [Rotaria sordida]CAF4047294.1 unnamed protein product [Rotaria sordida]